MMRIVIRSKIDNATVTDANLKVSAGLRSRKT